MFPSARLPEARDSFKLQAQCIPITVLRTERKECRWEWSDGVCYEEGQRMKADCRKTFCATSIACMAEFWGCYLGKMMGLKTTVWNDTLMFPLIRRDCAKRNLIEQDCGLTDYVAYSCYWYFAVQCPTSLLLITEGIGFILGWCPATPNEGFHGFLSFHSGKCWDNSLTEASTASIRCLLFIIHGHSFDSM